MNPQIKVVTDNIIARSQVSRAAYLKRIHNQLTQGKSRAKLNCGNLAHTVATCCTQEKDHILDFTKMNVGIISAYNDMVSAHQPYKDYPDKIKSTLLALGHSAQVAGLVPAMCDGITQGQQGMDMSLFSRDLIAQATAIGLSHNTFDAALLLGICDKIAPGQLMGALSFGHLPTAFVPSGPMATKVPNKYKVQIRQQYAAGQIDKSVLQEMENNSYHSVGTCTFYGTANTNQLVFEAMGLMLPGSAFVPVNTELREALTTFTAQQIIRHSPQSTDFRPLARIIDEKSLVNGIIALLASGGSTNHTIHLIAIAKAAGIQLTWDDFAQLSEVVPLLTRIYPNGSADINDFHQAGGVPLLLKKLADRGLLHLDTTPMYQNMEDYFNIPELDPQGKLIFQPIHDTRNPDVIAPRGQHFSDQGGLKVVSGNIGTGVIKVSAVEKNRQKLTALALVFEDQDEVVQAYHAGKLKQNAIIVVRNSGPAARGMPELHKLMPILGNVMEEGYQVMLVTDGRLSGASGKVPAIIHLSPESIKGGALAFIQNGDMLSIDVEKGTIQCLADLSQRQAYLPDLSAEYQYSGRELFNLFRKTVSSAQEGATILY